MNRAPKIVLRIIGVLGILCAVLGLLYNAAFSINVSNGGPKQDFPYFYPAFYFMTAVCIACYAVLIFFGVQFIRGRTVSVIGFAALMLFEMAYFFSIALMWLAPHIGRSVAAATGVANGGLMFQFIIFFPVWAPLVVFWAQRQQQQLSKNA